MGDGQGKDTVETNRKLALEMLERILGFDEVQGDRKVSFEEMVELMMKAMNMRSNKQQLDLLFKIYDSKDSGVINRFQIKRVANELGLELSESDIRAMIKRCSTDGSYIT